MKKILVTGADGFIGSHLVEALLKNKNNFVIALAYYNSFNSIGWLKNLKKKYKKNKLKIILGNICDSNFCINLTKNVDTIYHLAALVSIPYSYNSVKSYIDTNIIGTYNICMAAKLNKNKKLIFTSTSEVYGTAVYTPIDENHPLQPQSPYSASKISAEAIALSFQKSFNIALIIVRPFNTFGPRQSLRAIIPTIISQVLSDSKNIEVGNLKPTRDLNYVEDTCSALIKIANSKISNGEVINIGSGKEISILNLIKIIMSILKIKKKIQSRSLRIRPKNSEVFRLLCDNKKLKRLTKFKSKYNLKQGLKETIRWYQTNINFFSENIKDYNM